jgi:predicted O-methyltransferase YrrM
MGVNWFLFKHSLAYACCSKHARGHGVHSPFVYNLIRDVFLDSTKYPEYEIIEARRALLLNNHQQVRVQDFGAGSHVLASQTRKISSIARTSLSPKKYAQLLFRLVRYVNANHILEMGSSLGISGAYMGIAHPHTKLVSLEGSPEIAAIAQQTFTNCGVTQAEIRVGNFSDSLAPTLQHLQTIDFAFIDGNHQKQATIDYFEHIIPFCTNNTLLVFDDIYWSADMFAAWKHICADSRVRISIDICKLGIISLRTGIEKQDFNIRF